MSIDLTSTLDQVGGSGSEPGSVGEDLFRQYQRKEIEFEQYLNFSAIHAGELGLNVNPWTFTSPSEGLRIYVEKRLSGSIERDPVLHKALGDWSYKNRKALEHNLAEMEHLTWALNRIQKQGLMSLAEKVERAIERYLGVPKYLEFFLIDALKVHKRDMAARLGMEGR